MTDEALKQLLNKCDPYENIPEGVKDDILSAMKEAIQREAIEFTEWMSRNDWECVGVIDDERYWQRQDDVAIVTDSVYKEYLKSINP